MHVKTRTSLLVVAAYFAVLLAASLITDVMGLIGLLLIVVAMVAVVPLALWQGVRRLRRKSFLKWALLVPALMMIGGVFSLVVCIVRSPSPVLAEGSDVSEQLAYMHETDQGDRYTLRFLDPRRDKERLDRVLRLHTKNLIEEPDDQYAAALILQHGSAAAHFELAHQYATAARDANVRGGEWLFRATYDRWMIAIGEPPKYGTQLGFTIGGGSSQGHAAVESTGAAPRPSVDSLAAREHTMTDNPLPHFKYHPDPIGTGAIAPSDQVCECCGKARGYIYKASFYAVDEVESLCPWCIADGSAAKKFDGMFCDDSPLAEAGVDSVIVDEVTQRTPGFETWQQEVWLTHCNDACEFLGDATKADLVGVTQGKGQIIDGPDWSPDDVLKLTEHYEPKGSPAFYKFRCIHCGQILYGMDAL